jgi:hypothetical protein
VQQAWDFGDTLPVGDWHAAIELWPALRPRLAQRLRTLPDMQQRWLDALWQGQQVAAESARDWQTEIEVLAASLSTDAHRAVDELKLRTILVQQDAHRGHFGSASEARLVALSTNLRAQEPERCSQADLVVATLRTNRFAWRQSLDQIRHWGRAISRPGLLQRGRLNSMAGALAAGNRQYSTAANYLKNAVSLFSHYSDQSAVIEDLLRTRYHALFAWLDARALGHDAKEIAMQSLLVMHSPLIDRWNVSRIQVLATDPNPALRFEHRAFLKWALETSQTAALQHYVACRDSWCADDTWPWCWISWYRGWVLWPDDATGAVEHWRAAHAASAGGASDGVMTLVAAWMRVQLRRCGTLPSLPWPAAPDAFPSTLARRWPSEANAPRVLLYPAWSRALARALPMDFR